MPEPERTYVIVDGLQDPAVGRSLSEAWSDAGFDNAVDLAAQCAWLAPKRETVTDELSRRLSRASFIEADEIAGRFGLALTELRGAWIEPPIGDGLTVIADAQRWYLANLDMAVALGVPGLLLHYISARLSGDGAGAPVLWIGEMLVFAAACFVAGDPILRQGWLSLRRGVTSPDLFTLLIVLASFGQSVWWGVRELLAGWRWIGPTGYEHGLMLYAGWLAITMALLQRWLSYRLAWRRAGRGLLLIPGYHRLIAAWALVSLAAGALAGWPVGFATALLLPPMLALGAVNPWNPGWGAALPVFAFAVVFWFGPHALGLSISGYEIEVAAAFQLVMAASFALGWWAIGKR